MQQLPLDSPLPPHRRTTDTPRAAHARRLPPAAILLAILLVCAADAQPRPERATAPAASRSVHAERLATGAEIALDGRLDEEVWKREDAARDFVLKEPREGAHPSEATVVRFCFDDDALYVGAWMPCAAGRELRSSMGRRDTPGNSERIIISLDTYRDARTAFTFAVTADGVRTDYYHPDNSEFARDYSFDPVWEVRTTRDEEGWAAEFRIPFSQLRFSAGEVLVWGLNINHYVPSLNEDRYWVLVPKTETGWSSRMGTLTGIAGIAPSPRIEITPYVAGEARIDPRIASDDPFRTRTEFAGRAGVDAKMGLGPNLTLDATINPDFGQVEADPAEVNLTAYETVFSERRPFFVEGAQLLIGNGPTYFYSRRIGAAPRGTLSGDLVDSPTSTTILGATKVTGRLAQGTSIGALAALTAPEYATFIGGNAGRQHEELVEPLTLYGIVRAQQELDRDASTAGAMLTVVQRDMPDHDTPVMWLASRAVAGGADWSLRFRSGEYVLGGFAGFSAVEGGREAMLRLQRSSARYYQRPDRRTLRVDDARTSLAGWTANLSFERQTGTHWLGGIGASAESPGFEINDAGRLQSADDVESWAWLEYRETEPGDLFHAWKVNVWGHSAWNFEGLRMARGGDLTLTGTWKNFWSTTLYLYGEAEDLSDDLTRGGVLMLRPASIYGQLSTQSDYAANTRMSARVSGSRDALGGWAHTWGASVSLRLSDRWEASIDPAWSRSYTTRQYVTTQQQGSAATGGLRSVFAALERSTFSARLRMNYTFTPDLSLDFYAEPFLAGGRWSAPGELRAARSSALRMYGEDGTTLTGTAAAGSWIARDGADLVRIPAQDFLFVSFRSNVVLRWEWRRGSTLFLVWQQDRSASEAASGIVSPGDVFDALRPVAGNVLALKISWWLPA